MRFAVLWIDPKLVIVVAAGRALDGHQGLAGIERHVGRGVDVVGAIGVGGVDRDGSEVPAAAPETLLVVHQPPCCAGVVGEYTLPPRAVFGRGVRGPAPRRAPRQPRRDHRRRCPRDGAAEIIDDSPKPVGVAGRDGDADLADELVVGKSSGELLPGIAAIGGFVEASAGHVARARRPTTADAE